MDSIFLSPLPWQVCPLSRWVRSLDGLGPIVFAVLPLLLFLFSVGCLLVELVGIRVYVTGTLTDPGDSGELVCLRPFPCQPVGFWPLAGFANEDAVEAAKMRYYQAYFSEYPDIWCKSHPEKSVIQQKKITVFHTQDHGDHVIITASKFDNAGGLIMLGRSDGVL